MTPQAQDRERRHRRQPEASAAIRALGNACLGLLLLSAFDSCCHCPVGLNPLVPTRDAGACTPSVTDLRTESDSVKRKYGSRFTDSLLKAAVPLPRHFDWAEHGVVTPVRQQSAADCWAFASAGVAELAVLRNARERGLSVAPSIPFSEQEIVDCSNKGTAACGGWWAFDFGIDSGNTSGREYPYTGASERDPVLPGQKRACQQQFRAPASLLEAWGYVPADSAGYPSDSALKRAIVIYGPVGAGVLATQKLGSFNRDSGAVFEELNGFRGRINHLIIITGWDDSLHAWRVKNSWGPRWGDAGYAWVGYGQNGIGYGAAWLAARP